MNLDEIISRITPADALFFLLEILHNPTTDLNSLIKILASIDNSMMSKFNNQESIEAINKHFLAKYSPINKSIKDLFNKQSEHIFTPQTLKLIYTLILIPYTSDDLCFDNYYISSGVIYHKSNGENQIIAIFYLATMSLKFFKQKIKDNEEIPGVFDYYYNKLNDPAATIGRSKHVYNNSFFNNQISKHLKIDLNLLIILLQSLLLFTNKSSVIANLSFEKLKANDKAAVKQVLNLISHNLPIKRLILSRNDLILSLSKKLQINTVIRETPFIYIDSQYICIQKALLNDIISDFPFYFLDKKYADTDKVEKIKLRTEFGHSYEAYINLLAERSVNKKIEKNPKYTLNKSQAEYCDLLIHIDQHNIVMWETKSARSTEQVKESSKSEIIKKYVKQERNTLKQMLKHAVNYRKNLKYDGMIFLILSYFDSPIIQSFDTLVEEELNDLPEYQEYKKSSKIKIIYFLNVNIAEMFFSFLLQKADITDLLNELAQIQTFAMVKTLQNFARKNNLHFSIGPLMKIEIAVFEQEQKALFNMNREI